MLLDDRPVRPGVMFADADLLGIPHRVVMGERGLDAGTVEYRTRRERDAEALVIGEAPALVAARVREELAAGEP